MGYIFNVKKNRLKVGMFICYKGLTYRIIGQLTDTIFKLVDCDVINEYKARGLGARQCPYIKKDLRELGGCEVW